MNVRYPSRIASPHLGVTSVITAATAFGYVGLLGQQGDWPGIDARQQLVLTLLIGFAVLAAVGTFALPIPVRAGAAASCAAGLLALGILAVFSIGLVLMLAGLLALLAWLRAGNAARRGVGLAVSLASAMATIAALVLGLAATG